MKLALSRTVLSELAPIRDHRYAFDSHAQLLSKFNHLQQWWHRLGVSASPVGARPFPLGDAEVLCLVALVEDDQRILSAGAAIMHRCYT
jgi:hypothetical protein